MLCLRSTGFSLIEVLISLFLLSCLLLGLEATEIFSLRVNRSAYFFSVAENQLNSMAERLRVLDSNQDLAKQITIWNQQNQEVLPQGRGVMTGNTLTIYWGGESSCPQNKFGQAGCLKIMYEKIKHAGHDIN